MDTVGKRIGFRKTAYPIFILCVTTFAAAKTGAQVPQAVTEATTRYRLCLASAVAEKSTANSTSLMKTSCLSERAALSSIMPKQLFENLSSVLQKQVEQKIAQET